MRSSNATRRRLSGTRDTRKATPSASRRAQHGPKTLEGIAGVRAARTRHERWSVEGRALARWRRMCARNGRRSLLKLARSCHAPQGGLCALLNQAEEIPPVALEKQLAAIRRVIADQDADRLRAKGLLPPLSARERAQRRQETAAAQAADALQRASSMLKRRGRHQIS